VSPASRFALRFIEAYQTQVSAQLGTSCRFEPTCSEYGRQVYLRDGFVRATLTTARRLRRCRGGPGPVISDPI
jgi:putative membrane protein insertion efficiency factor